MFDGSRSLSREPEDVALPLRSTSVPGETGDVGAEGSTQSGRSSSRAGFVFRRGRIPSVFFGGGAEAERVSGRSSTSSSRSSSSHHIPPRPSLYTPLTPPPTCSSGSRLSIARLSLREDESRAFDLSDGTAPVSRACLSTTRRTLASREPPSSICESCISWERGSAPDPPPGAIRCAYRECGVDDLCDLTFDDLDDDGCEDGVGFVDSIFFADLKDRERRRVNDFFDFRRVGVSGVGGGRWVL